MRFIVVVLWFALVVAAPTAQIGQGKRLYESQCGSCHGPLGNGGKGANLARPQLRYASDDQALLTIIRRGIPGTEMSGSALSPSQVSRIADYVRTLGRVEQVEVPGDAARGAEIYAAECEQCHTLASGWHYRFKELHEDALAHTRNGRARGGPGPL